MLPRFTQTDSPEGRVAEAIFSAQGCIRHTVGFVFADLADLFGCHFRSVMSFAGGVVVCIRHYASCVSPIMPSNDFANRRDASVELCGEGSSIFSVEVPQADFRYLAFGKLGVGVFATTQGKLGVQSVPIPIAARATPAYDFIAHVLSVIAESKVFLSHAGAHVAGVQNEFTDRVFSVVKQIRRSVGAYAHSSDVKNSVASFSECGSPDPAFSLRAKARGLINFFPESLDVLLREGWNCSRLGVRHLSFLSNGTCLGSDAAFSRHAGPFLFYPHPA